MEQQIKSGDTVELIKEVYSLTIGKVYNVVDVSEDGRIIHIKDDDGDYRKRHKTEFKLKSSNMELKTTKDKVLAEAAKYPTAKATLETLFPEAFEGDAKYTTDKDVMKSLLYDKSTAVIDESIDKWVVRVSDNMNELNDYCFHFELIIREDGRSEIIPTRKTS